MTAVNNPEDANAGTRKVPFSRELYIEQEDFREDPPKEFFRLSPGREVRLRYGYFIKCTSVVKNAQGEVTEVHCTYDPATHGGNSPDGRKVKATMHWLAAAQAVSGEVRMYDTLFLKEDPNQVEEGQISPPTQPEVVRDHHRRKLEPSPANAEPGTRLQSVAWLFLRRYRFQARPSGFQPHYRASRIRGPKSRNGAPGKMIIRNRRPARRCGRRHTEER